MKKSFVLKQNIECMIMNYVKNYLWEGKDINNSINRTLYHYSSEYGLENDIRTEDIKQFIIDTMKLYCNDIQSVTKAINKLKESYMISSTKKFFIDNEIPFKTVSDYQLFLNNAILPMIV
jgi:hypothetical protein